MNREQLRTFREIFEDDMNNGGFVWRHQMYVHVDFQQFWLLAVWPRVSGQGNLFDVHFGIFLMNSLDPEKIKLIHTGHLLSLSEHFGEGSSGYISNAGELWNTVENYRYVFNVFQHKASPIFHGIRSTGDALDFRLTHACLPTETEEMEFIVGRHLVELLIYLHRDEEIPEIIRRIKSLLYYRIERDRQNPIVYQNPVILGCSPKQAERRVSLAKKEYVARLAARDKRERGYSETQMAIDLLEHTLQTVDHTEIAAVVYNNMKRVSDNLQKQFSKSEIIMMRTKW